MESYDHKKIESKWQKEWLKSKIYKTLDKKKGAENFYSLVEFPYPSGNLHVGHWYAFAVPDIFARYKRMQGLNVMFPIGFDAFGLPAENAAIKRGLNPRKWTYENIEYMESQIQSMGASFDWSRKVVTADPEYYRFTQWMFNQFFKKGLAYQKKTPANWCSSCKTVLANEQVVNGKCERCGTEVEKKEILQWNLKITDYAERLLSGLDNLSWPEPIKDSQRNWIGKSEGAEIDFKIKIPNQKTRFVILHGWTGRADKNFIPWLKKELESRGHEVEAPQMPNTEKPKESEQVEHVINNCHFDENTVLIGHSLGAVVAMKTIMKLNRKISGLVLVAPAIDPTEFQHAESRPFWKTFNWGYDYELIKNLTDGKIAVISDTKEEFRTPYLKFLAEKLSAAFIESKSNREHFCGLEEPAVLKSVTPQITVFTTRPDTIFGATYLVLSPENEVISDFKFQISNWKEVEEYIRNAKKKTEIERTAEGKEKTGVELKGVKAINPATKEEIPVFVADYVLSGYGTGAIMAVPAHDQRDFEFAKKFNLPVRRVIEPKFIDTKHESAVKPDLEFVKRNAVCVIVRNPKDSKYLCISWKGIHMNGLVTGGINEKEDVVEAARREVQEETGYKNLKLVKKSDFALHSLFFHRVKQQNRWARFQYVFFDLENEDKDPVDEKEASLHEVVWKSKDELKNFFSVIEGKFVVNLLDNPNYIYSGDGVLFNSEKFDWMDSKEAKDEITKFVGGTKKTTYKLRDWGVSRQRYWGVPIPIIHCEKCGQVPVPDKDLPVKLPEIKDYLPRDDGKSPLAKAEKWVNVKCPKCKGKAERETDTLDTFVDSSWYFLRYTDPKNKKEFATKKNMKKWMPVDFYSGGAEHTTMHLLYSRFWQKALFDLGLVKDEEPYKMRMNRGLILGPDGNKMSKSKGNVIDPDEVVKNLGADTVRVYLAFIGPFNEIGSYPWSTDGIVGVKRFLEKVWKLQEKVTKGDDVQDETLFNQTIKKVGEDIESLKMNTAVSQLMIFVNGLSKQEKISKKEFETLLILLSPLAPHITEELWNSMRHKKSIHLEKWPGFDSSKIKSAIKIAVQINGKVREVIEIEGDTTEETIKEKVLALQSVKKRLENMKIKKTIYVTNRIFNIITD